MEISKESDSQSHPFHWHFTELEDHDFEIRGRTLYYIIALFAIVLAVSLVLIYWRCFSRCRSNPSTPNSHAPTPPPPQPRGLDPATIRSLPISLVTNGQFPEADCSICLGVFGDGDKVKVLPQCQHLYHSECVDKWLSNEPSCPLCRSSIQVDSHLHPPPRIVIQ
ncbi:hypothetical protein SLE2022_072030 [Rubroshorea leprosula]